jgi:hypothetical protein
MAPVREVAFELECFEWADERLEVAGRWTGIGPRRLSRAVLTVETDTGRRKRIVALPGGQVAGAGEPWRASFSWHGDPAEIMGAALEVGGNLVVDLPLPDRKRRRRRRPAPDTGADEVLRAEVGALRGQVDRLRAELAGREREIIALRAQLDEESDDEPAVPRAAADDRTIEVARLAGELERLREEQAAVADERTVEIQQLARERDEARAERTAEDERLRAEHAHLQEELDALREAFSDAAAEAEAARDQHRAQVEALEDELRTERAEIARLTAALAGAADARARPDAAEGDAAPRGETEHDRAAGPPTQPMPPPVDALEPEDDAPPQAGPPTQAMPAPFADDEAESAPEPSAAAADPAGNDPTAVEAAVLDAPGPLRAGSRPVTPPGAQDQPDASRLPAWLRGGGAREPGESSALGALRDRFHGRSDSNGHAAEAEAAVQPSVPRPRRSAAPARARAGATVAARRSRAEVWALRVVAVLLVVVLLTAFVLILTYIA